MTWWSPRSDSHIKELRQLTSRVEAISIALGGATATAPPTTKTSAKDRIKYEILHIEEINSKIEAERRYGDSMSRCSIALRSEKRTAIAELVSALKSLKRSEDPEIPELVNRARLLGAAGPGPAERVDTGYPKDTVITISAKEELTSTHRAQLQEIEEVVADQDKILGEIDAAVTELGEIANKIGDELALQEVMIRDLDKHADKVADKMDRTLERTQHATSTARSSNACVYLVCFILLVIVAVVLYNVITRK